ncbi:glycosyltransferase [Tenuifilum thalassicum]|uniref:Glycosyltransferase n=1 Tax=Tenuifilum thalassicum TaxID=2590900 RepID=A0A7D3XHI3_9BACT|nr:glycosyltransferase [Tenuifilum thalassicum]QKG80597.1 glycosyltransferase [Tenuifilum thalassicum]
MRFSVIIPVFNRPDEVDELLKSLIEQTYNDFEVIVVEDGSSLPCRDVVDKYSDKLNVRYFYKKNGGPGLARNFGAEKANGEYLIFLDSDCIVPNSYFELVNDELTSNYVDFFGGPDATHHSFTSIQKAIGYSMTSFFTTGGIRGGKLKLERFTPRSFNMGVSFDAFRAVNGFSNMRFGEDVDLSLRLFEKGYKSRLFPAAFVYHKRRTDFRKFFKQVFNSGMARINLAINHKGALKLVHLLPSGFVVAMSAILVASFFFPILFVLPILYSLMLFVDSLVKGNGFVVGLLGVVAAWVQLYGYGLGFIYALWLWMVHGTKPQGAFVKNFYR